MRDFDPFRLSQRFEPEKVEGDLPPLGLVMDPDDSTEMKSSSRTLLPTYAFQYSCYCLWDPFLCQMDSEQPIMIPRSIFE